MACLDTKQQCRCPRCKALVRRVICQDTSQFMADCSNCGTHALADIEQPPIGPMDAASIIAFSGAAHDLPRKRKIRMRRPVDRSECDPAIAAVEALREDLGISMNDMSIRLGYSGNWLANHYGRHRNGVMGQRAAKAILIAVTAYRRKMETNT